MTILLLPSNRRERLSPFVIVSTAQSLVMTQPTPASIASLPTETMLEFSSFLSYADVFALSMTCRQFQELALRGPYTMGDLLRIELLPCYDGAAPSRPGGHH